MSEITKQDLIINGVDKACELLKELTEIPGLYFLEFKFTCDSSNEAPSIDYHVIKYTGMEKNNEKKNRLVSTDPKPLWVPHGTIIQEGDTEDYYIFDANDKIWKKLMADLR